MTKGPKVVCFDLGGVILEIRHTWEEVCAYLGFKGPAGGSHPLSSFRPFVEYQAGSLDSDDYLSALAGWLGVSLADARSAHEAILIRDYPEALELVRGLRAYGVFTCCFSNTNDLHWPVLCDPQRHPAIAALDLRIASHELGLAKPDPAAYRAVEGLLPADARILFFDDSEENVEAARAAAWEAHRIDPEAGSIEQLRSRLALTGVR